MLGLERPRFCAPCLHVSEHCPLPPGKAQERWSATAPGLVLSEENVGSRCCHSLGKLFRVHPSALGEDSAPLWLSSALIYSASYGRQPPSLFLQSCCVYEK